MVSLLPAVGFLLRAAAADSPALQKSQFKSLILVISIYNLFGCSFYSYY